MAVPKSRPTRVQAPAWAGAGLCFRWREADPSWPPDWWQRNYDSDLDDPDDPDPEPLTERELRVPPPPP
jgi:hypothetical protein